MKFLDHPPPTCELFTYFQPNNYPPPPPTTPPHYRSIIYSEVPPKSDR